MHLCSLQRTPLALAAFSGEVDCIRALLDSSSELGADVNTKDVVRATLPVPAHLRF